HRLNVATQPIVRVCKTRGGFPLRSRCFYANVDAAASQPSGGYLPSFQIYTVIGALFQSRGDDERAAVLKPCDRAATSYAARATFEVSRHDAICDLLLGEGLRRV